MHWLLVGYMFLFIHRPFEFWPLLGDIHLERLYIGAVFVVWLLQPKQWLPNAQHMAYAAFAFAVLLCWMMSPWAEQGEHVVEDWFKIVFFYCLMVTCVHDEKSLRQLALGFVIVMGVYMTHSFKEYLSGRHTYRMGIARMIGVDTTQGDPNSFGASIVFALPFATLFWRTSRSTWIRLGVVTYLCLSAGCILLTGSRSSLLGLVLFGAITIFRSPHRMWGIALALIACPIVFVAMPDELQTRFETIVNPDVGPENAKVSGEGRLEGLTKGFDLWMQNPATGCGPGAWRPATHSKLESHNLYGQIMGEMGSIGVMTFLMIVIAFWVNLRWMKHDRAYHPERRDDFAYHLAGAVGMGIFLMLFEGNFGHNLFRHNWLWYGGFLIIARHCLATRYVPVMRVYSGRVRVPGMLVAG
ncbi:MAG: O-antigen ligase family protein [Planctomycetes bacterium]|nr:O-antigen ligase family protein [Planctomycetota bacterium]